MSGTADHFDQIAPRYAELRAAPGFADPVTAAVARLANLTGARVLDVGCGPGTVLAQLVRDHGIDGAGVDSSAAMIAEARRILPEKVELHVATAEALPFADRSFDVVLMRMVAHLVDRPTVFRDIARVLRPGGRVAITTTDPAAVGSFWIAPYFPSYGKVDGPRFPLGDELCDELRDAGFPVPEVTPFTLPRRFDREEALEKLRGRAYSTLALLPEGEYERGLAHAEASLPDEIAYDLRLLHVVAAV